MLTLEDVHITQDEFQLRASLAVPSGSRTAVLGPSGAGKSTLLGAIAGFVPHRGRIAWQGKDISHLSPGDRPVSILFQDNNLFPHLTAAQNVGLGLDPRLRLSPGQRQQVRDALDKTGLPDHAGRKPGALSGGQQGRVALARILVQSRPLVLLDEPFAALGPALRRDMLRLVADLPATVLMVSHNIEDARRFASHVVWVDRAMAHGARPAAEFFGNPPEGLSAYL